MAHNHQPWWPMMARHQPPPQLPQMFVVPHLGPPPARTYVVPFHEQELVVTVAKDPLDVDRWIQGVCSIFWHSLNKLVVGSPRVPDSLRWFLNNPSFTFCGVGIKGDADKLFARYRLTIGRALDLHELYRDCYKGEYWHVSLKNMCSRVLGKEMKKLESVTLSAWDAYHLSVEHAAVDAYVSLSRLVTFCCTTAGD